MIIKIAPENNNITRDLQNALTMLETRTGCIEIPQGLFEITSTLVYNGNPKYAIKIIGAEGRARSGRDGTVLNWGGSDDEPMFHFKGSNGLTLKDILFSSNNSSATVFLDAENTEVHGAAGSSFTNIENCTFYNSYSGDEERACLQIGHNPAPKATPQVSEIRINRCMFRGSYNNATGIKIPVGGNVKHIDITQSFFSKMKNGIDAPHGNGQLNISETLFTRLTGTAIIGGADRLLVRGCNFEGINQIVYKRGGTNPNFTEIVGCEIHSSGVNTIDCHGSLVIRGNEFKGATTKILVGALLESSGLDSLISEQNWFNSEEYPYYDGGGRNKIFGEGYYFDKFVAARTWGDISKVKWTKKRLPTIDKLKPIAVSE